MKLILAGFSIFASLVCSGQNQVGLFAGAHTSAAHYLVKDNKQKATYKPGFCAGVNMKVPFDGNLYFNPAVFYSMKGYDIKFTDFTFPPDANAINNSTSIHTFEMAALLQYDFSKTPGHFFIKGGPTLDFQLFGKEKFDLANGTTVSRNIKWGYGDYNRFGANLLAQFGYETGSGFVFTAGYTHGIGSLSNADEGPKIYHRVFGLSIGKYLKNKKIIIDTRNRE